MEYWLFAGSLTADATHEPAIWLASTMAGAATSKRDDPSGEWWDQSCALRPTLCHREVYMLSKPAMGKLAYRAGCYVALTLLAGFAILAFRQFSDPRDVW